MGPLTIVQGRAHRALSGTRRLGRDASHQAPVAVLSPSCHKLILVPVTVLRDPSRRAHPRHLNQVVGDPSGDSSARALLGRNAAAGLGPLRPAGPLQERPTAPPPPGAAAAAGGWPRPQ